jgi:hypothetical protein
MIERTVGEGGGGRSSGKMFKKAKKKDEIWRQGGGQI